MSVVRHQSYCCGTARIEKPADSVHSQAAVPLNGSKPTTTEPSAETAVASEDVVPAEKPRPRMPVVAVQRNASTGPEGLDDDQPTTVVPSAETAVAPLLPKRPPGLPRPKKCGGWAKEAVMHEIAMNGVFVVV